MILPFRLAAVAASVAVLTASSIAPSSAESAKADQTRGAKISKSKDAKRADTNASSAKVAAADPKTAAKEPTMKSETFGEWDLQCFEPKMNGLKCQVVQKLVSNSAKQLVLVVSVAYAPESKKHLLQVALPLNFMLKPGVEIAIGDSKTVVQVDRCSTQGCFVEGIAGEDLIAKMISADKGDVKFLATADKRMIIPFSLTGFTKAYQKMKDLNG